MGLYIRGAEMPKTCGDCELCYHDDYFNDRTQHYHCILLKYAETLHEQAVGINRAERHRFCPLIEVKTPHGRLIDADELESKMIKTYRYFNVKFDLAEAETVVEREV